MPKKTFTAETTAAAELFNPAPAPAPVADQERPKPAKAPAKAPAAPTTTEPPQIITWKARPDGERRDRRLQIVCKTSVALKAAEIARARGISVAYLFEKLILEQWEKDHGQN